MFLHTNLSPKWSLAIPADFNYYHRRWQVSFHTIPNCSCYSWHGTFIGVSTGNATYSCRINVYQWLLKPTLSLTRRSVESIVVTQGPLFLSACLLH